VGFLNANIANDTIESRYFIIINLKPLLAAAIAQHQNATALRQVAHTILQLPRYY
jgi:hypothetical protein